MEWRRPRGLLTAAAFMAVLTGCSGGAKQETASVKAAPEQIELVVSAAASLTESLQQLQKSYEAKHPNVKLRLNLGASGALQQQIEQGAPADLFLSAAAKNMELLVSKGLIDKSQQTMLLTNELVLIVPKKGEASEVKEMADLTRPDVKHIAIGEPESVPAGGYAKEALTNAKLWNLLQPKLVYGKDVRQVLTYVETGDAEAGYVYKTDALASTQARIVQSVDAKLVKPIEYPVGIVKATRHASEAKEFFGYLQSKEASGVFAGYGFTPVKP